MASDNPPRRLAAIVCIDMAGYSALAEQDEERAAAAVSMLHRLVEEVAGRHSGRIFNTAGDGFLLEFPSANSALAAALTVIQQPGDGAPPVRIGIHLGDVMVTNSGDLLGHTVNVAARLQTEAGENCIIVSKTVFDLIRGPNAARLVPIGAVDIDKTSASVEAFAYDPTGPHGVSTGRRPRKRWLMLGAAGVAVAALAIALWTAGVVGANRQSMLRQLSAELTRQVASTGNLNQESIDSVYFAVSDLSQSSLPSERTAFSLLRGGQVEGAVAALESFAADLERQGMGDNAAEAFGRAGALVQAADKQRALANFRRAFELAPRSMERFAGLAQAIVSSEGYTAGLAFAAERAADPESGPEIAAYANLYSSILTGDMGATTRQRRYIAAAEEILPRLSNPYLRAFDKVARGYLAFQELDLRTARALYQEGRADLAHVPGHERDHQQGWLLILSAMGDFESAWRDGRAFVAERNQSGAPPWSQMMVTTCIAGLQVDRPARVEPYCAAGAAGIAGSIGEPSGEIALAMLATEKNDLVAARAHLDAARASRWYSASPSNSVYAGWVEARIAYKEGHIEQMNAVLDRTLRRIRATPALAPREPMFAAFLERRRADGYLAVGQVPLGCAALTRAIAAYQQVGGDRGSAAAQQLRDDLECSV